MIVELSIALMLFGTGIDPQIPENPTATLVESHPRLIIDNRRLERIKSLIGKDETVTRYSESVASQANRIFDEDFLRYEIPDGLRLLSVSRRCVHRVYLLATMFRLTGERRYRDRAVAELRAAAAFPDWNPRHFLDTAEMTHAFAIGYDWLYETLSADERKMISDAIVEKGIKPAMKVYESNGWWAKCDHNWNQVCNGGIGLGVLAIAEEIPDLADTVLKYALESIKIPMRVFAPDGGWAEGPGYWRYATSYNVYFLAGLVTALGTDFGLSDMPGFDQTGDFCIHMTGPFMRTFNYADGGDRAPHSPHMFWLAERFNKPEYAWYEQQMTRRSADPLDLLWYYPDTTDPIRSGTPLDRWFKNIDVVFMRSEWMNEQATFIGFKGGDNKANHSHLDLGTFVLDANGERWAVDLGADDYNMPGYFGNKRWTYYRLKTEGHNLFTFGLGNQSPRAAAPIVEFNSTESNCSAKVDLSQAYSEQVKQAFRTISLVDRRYVVIRDEIKPNSRETLRWHLHTPAKVSVEEGRAIMEIGGKRMILEVVTPADVIIEAEPVKLAPPQRRLEGITRISIIPKVTGDPLIIEVKLTPEM